jgi:hypothetical protein
LRNDKPKRLGDWYRPVFTIIVNGLQIFGHILAVAEPVPGECMPFDLLFDGYDFNANIVSLTVVLTSYNGIYFPFDSSPNAFEIMLTPTATLVFYKAFLFR